jgi:hypothetical protein
MAKNMQILEKNTFFPTFGPQKEGPNKENVLKTCFLGVKTCEKSIKKVHFSRKIHFGVENGQKYANFGKKFIFPHFGPSGIRFKQGKFLKITLF